MTRSTQAATAADDPAVAMIDLLVTEIGLSERLLALIAQEKLHMEQQLQAAPDFQLQDKLALLQALQNASEARIKLMQQHGFQPGAQGVAALCAAWRHLPDLPLAFRRLAGLARECHAANQHLGLLLNRKSGFFARLLGGLADGGVTPLYQANGYRDQGSTTLRHRLSV